MNGQQGFWQFILLQWDKLLSQTITHIGLTFASLLLAVIIGVPLAILISRKEKLAGWVLTLAGILQTIPSVALLGFMIPLFGIGTLPAVAVLFLYALLPIIRNTFTGITGVDEAIRDAARGMGMTNRQILLVELPLAMPVMFAGIRTATVINVGVATLAAYIAGGGLGEFIFGGIALNNTNMILAGAIPAALLAILLDFMLGKMQLLKPESLKKWVFILPFSVLILSSFYLIPASNSKLLAGYEPEFMGRMDGYLGLKSRYKLNLPSVVISDAVMYEALFEKKLDVIGGYSTDGRLKAYNLMVLKDDKTIFPPYYAAPLVRSEILDKYPQLAATLNLVAGKINDSTMTELNYRADILKQTPEEVAKAFLVSAGLWKAPRGGKGPTIRIGCKIFGEQYILTEIYRLLLEGNTDFRVETKTGLGELKFALTP